MNNLFICDLSGKKTVTDLQAAYEQAKQFQQYDGNNNYKKEWLLIACQLRFLKGYTADQNKVEKFLIKKNKIEQEFDANWNDGRSRNIGFCAAGYLSKASSNYMKRHRNKIGNLATESVRNKLIAQIIDFAKERQEMNGREMLLIMNELDSNKYLSDNYKYFDGENNLLEIHSNLLLWLNKYSPSYVYDYVSNVIGKRWAIIETISPNQ